MYGVIDTKGGTENIERMLRRFKRVTESAGVLADIKKRQSYEKPSEKKRRMYKDAIRRGMLDKLPQRKSKRKDREEGRHSHNDY